MTPWVACVAVIAFSLPASAIEGRYRVEGRNPGQIQSYRGEAVIRKSGETFSIVWQIGANRQIGTGIRTGSVLSVVFQSVGAAGGGVASFEIVDDTVRTGLWAPTGSRSVGSEQWSIESGL